MQISINKWMDKWSMVYQYNEIVLNLKIIINTWNCMDEYQNNYTGWKKAKRITYYVMSILQTSRKLILLPNL